MIMRSLAAPNHGVRLLAHTLLSLSPEFSECPAACTNCGILRLGPVGRGRKDLQITAVTSFLSRTLIASVDGHRVQKGSPVGESRLGPRDDAFAPRVLGSPEFS